MTKTRGEKCGMCGTFTVMRLAYICGECGHYFNVPICLTDEVRALKTMRVNVRSARCLRWGNTGCIKVFEDQVPIMESLGYEHLNTSLTGPYGDEWCCFKPKTEMPNTKEPRRFEDWIRSNS